MLKKAPYKDWTSGILMNKMFIFMVFNHQYCMKNSKFWHNQPWNKSSEDPMLCFSGATELIGTFPYQTTFHPGGLIFGRLFWVSIINMSILKFPHKTYSVSHLCCQTRSICDCSFKKPREILSGLIMNHCRRTSLMQNYSLYFTLITFLPDPEHSAHIHLLYVLYIWNNFEDTKICSDSLRVVVF